MIKFLSAITSLALFAIPFVGFTTSANAYSQDPRSCGDPRTQYPSNPPC
jgi:hypothetical protein